jgi:hypothetical protein
MPKVSQQLAPQSPRDFDQAEPPLNKGSNKGPEPRLRPSGPCIAPPANQFVISRFPFLNDDQAMKTAAHFRSSTRKQKYLPHAHTLPVCQQTRPSNSAVAMQSE